MEVAKQHRHSFVSLHLHDPSYITQIPLYRTNCESRMHGHISSPTHLPNPTQTNSFTHPIQNPKRHSQTNLESSDEAPAPVDVAVLDVHHAARVQKRQRIQRLNNHRANAGLERTNRGLAGKWSNEAKMRRKMRKKKNTQQVKTNFLLLETCRKL